MLQTKVRTGELDRRVSFIQKQISDGASNEDYIEGWELIGTPTVWARKIENKGSEVIIADRLTYIQRTTFTIRYRTGIDVKMRLVYSGNVYEIISITDNGATRNTYLDIVANILENQFFEVSEEAAFTAGFSSGFES
jgi:SPP1 family predicted phage head-tail adaptor